MKYLSLLSLLGALLVVQSCGNKDDGGPEEESKGELINKVPEFFAENYEADYGSMPPEATVVAGGLQGLEAPRDLEFHPFEDRKTELWVLSPGTQNTGGTTTIFSDPITNGNNAQNLTDGNAWHFLALGTSLAFGENGNWATAQGIVDANRRGGIFTGPTLWSSDMDIYAQIGRNPTAEVNGSHLDMLHQSPLGMGIAHEVDNVYWVFDGYNKSICRYDFAAPHYPGGYDHDDGRVWRYTGLGVQMNFDTNIPNHMVLDKETNWLYITDPGSKRVVKMDITSGTQRTVPTVPRANNEVLALYQEMEGATVVDVLTDGLNAPCGIALVENRLFIGDYRTGEITCVDKTSHEVLGVYDTGAQGLTGLEIGPEGKLWYVNALTDDLVRLQPAAVEL